MGKKIFNLSLLFLLVFTSGNFSSNSVWAQTVDTTPPVITLTGPSTINLNIGDTYTEQGATATDDVDTSVTVLITGSVDTNTAGNYIIHYNASDTAGNTATEVIRTINVNTVAVHMNIQANVDVPTSCSATDTDGLVHNYSENNSYLAICALETAIQNGSISSAQFSNQFPSLGLFITSINNVTASSNSQYWAIYQNGSFANSGITSLPVSAGDVIMIQLHDFSDNNLGDQVTLNIHSLIRNTPSGNSSGGRMIIPPPPIFDIQKALAYLKSTQNPDGSFGSSLLYYDWAGIALGAMNVTDSSKTMLLSYFNSHNVLSSLLTDNERHAMALLALGQNPYSFNNVNYIKAITDNFDGTQFGDANLVNDDIFALIPLKNSGYTVDDNIISKDIAFLISKQKVDGSILLCLR